MKRCAQCSFAFEHSGWTCPSCGAEPAMIDGFQAFAPDLAHQNDGFHAHLYTELAALEDSHFWFQSRNELIIWALCQTCPHLRTMMEIGCGTGFVLAALTQHFPQATFTGSEIYSAGLKFAAARAPRAEFIQMDALNSPFYEHFDAIGAFDVLEHIKADEDVLRNIHKALRPQGCLIATVPQHRWLWSRHDVASCHVRRYEADELRAKVTAAGFSILFETSFVTFLLPLMVFSRLRHKKQANTDQNIFDPLSDLRIGKVLNGILRAIMRFEGLLIKAGLRLPFGGSRLIVARKG